MLLNGAAQIEETAKQLAERLRNSASRQWSMPIFSQFRCRVVSECQLFYNAPSVIHLFLKIARKVDEASNFDFVQLIETEPGMYDKRHLDYARQDKIDLACERISHETKESFISHILLS
jgi:hypothetical protein